MQRSKMATIIALCLGLSWSAGDPGQEILPDYLRIELKRLEETWNVSTSLPDGWARLGILRDRRFFSIPQRRAMLVGIRARPMNSPGPRRQVQGKRSFSTGKTRSRWR